ncbi:MAG: hypothetical protein HFJ99_03065 [Eubacterium sp.]|nr:hypothetical protein [Eubacterium sp.]
MNLSVDLINFDPDFMNVIVSYFGVCGKYAMIFALFGTLTTMVVKAFKGKERFI